MPGWLSILLGCVGLVGFYLALGWLMRRQQAMFAGTADKWFAELGGRGWRVTRGETTQEFTLENTLRGVPVSYAQKYVPTGAGDDEKWAISALASAAIPVSVGDLTVQSEGVLDRVAKMLGGQDIALDDQEFDAAFRTRCTDPEIARRTLTKAARQALLKARARLGDALYLRDGKVCWNGTSATPGMDIEQLAELLANTANMLGR